MVREMESAEVTSLATTADYGIYWGEKKLAFIPIATETSRFSC